MGASSQERRKTNRLPMAVPVVLKTADGDLLTESRNIGNEGVFVRSPSPLSVGSKLRMTFSVPRRDVVTESVHFDCGGTVVRLEPMEDGFGIAIAWRGASVCAAG